MALPRRSSGYIDVRVEEYEDLKAEVERLRGALNQAANDLHIASGLFRRHLPGVGSADDFDQRGRRAREALLR